MLYQDLDMSLVKPELTDSRLYVSCNHHWVHCLHFIIKWQREINRNNRVEEHSIVLRKFVLGLLLSSLKHGLSQSMVLTRVYVIRIYICSMIVTRLSNTSYSIGLLFQFPIILLSWLWLESEFWNILPQTYLIYAMKDKQYCLWVLAWNIFSANKSW